MIFPDESEQDARLTREETMLEYGPLSSPGEYTLQWEDDEMNEHQVPFVVERDAEESDLTMRASTNTELDVETAQKVLRLVDLLEGSDDVQEVYYNADIPEEAYEAQA